MDERRSRAYADERAIQCDHRASPKSWGAEYTAPGEMRFRIWAPAVQALSLRLIDEDVPMSPVGDGWYELVATNIAPDTPYAFILPNGTSVPDPAGRALESDVHGRSLGERRWQLRCNFSDDRVTLPPVHGDTIHVMPREAASDIRDLANFPPHSLIVACG